MGLFTLEHSKAAYRTDFALYGTAVAVLSVFLVVLSPHGRLFEISTFLLLGLISWTGMEYALHRFVLHGLQPFRRWHAEHHLRPRALIGTPTILSATLIATLVFLPALIAGNVWRACGLTLGLLMGYLAYATMHHALHHWRAEHAWLKKRKLWHALHHQEQHPAYYGVTTSLWDHVFGSAGQRRPLPIDKPRTDA